MSLSTSRETQASLNRGDEGKKDWTCWVSEQSDNEGNNRRKETSYRTEEKGKKGQEGDEEEGRCSFEQESRAGLDESHLLRGVGKRAEAM